MNGERHEREREREQHRQEGHLLAFVFLYTNRLFAEKILRLLFFFQEIFRDVFRQQLLLLSLQQRPFDLDKHA